MQLRKDKRLLLVKQFGLKDIVHFDRLKLRMKWNYYYLHLL